MDREWIIISNWFLSSDARGSVVGVCEVSFPEPYNSLDFRKGFPLPNPTHVRCAAYSLWLAIDACSNANFIDVAGDRVTVIVKSPHLAEMVRRGPRARTPSLVCKIFDAMKAFRHLEVIYMPRDPEDKPVIDIAHDDEETKKMSESERLKSVGVTKYMAPKIFASGARPSRPGKKMSKKSEKKPQPEK